MLEFPDAPARGDFAHSRLWDGGKWMDEENHWVVTGYPVAAMLDFPRDGVPRYWLPADGSEVSRTDYPALYAKIGDKFGDGDGSTTFNLPDTRAVSTIGGTVGQYGGDERISPHTHPVTDYGHTHGFTDPSHAHSLAQNNHSHGVPDPGHAHGLPQSPHDHGVGDPGHNHAVHDPGHSHWTQEHSWGYWHPSHEVEGVDSASIIDSWNTIVDGNYTGVWNDANWAGTWWYGEYAWISCNGAGTGVSFPAANISVSYDRAGVGLVLNNSTAGSVTTSTGGNGIAGNVQPSLITRKIIYTGVP